jgi:hypothetical protein
MRATRKNVARICPRKNEKIGEDRNGAIKQVLRAFRDFITIHMPLRSFLEYKEKIQSYM